MPDERAVTGGAGFLHRRGRWNTKNQHHRLFDPGRLAAIDSAPGGCHPRRRSKYRVSDETSANAAESVALVLRPVTGQAKRRVAVLLQAKKRRGFCRSAQSSAGHSAVSQKVPDRVLFAPWLSKRVLNEIITLRDFCDIIHGRGGLRHHQRLCPCVRNFVTSDRSDKFDFDADLAIQRGSVSR